MNHKDRNQAKRFDSPERNARFTDLVYSCDGRSRSEINSELSKTVRAFEPAENPYRLWFGDLHGHTNLSDGLVDPDTFFRNLRDEAKVDFCALSDHDHGGVGKPPLWGIDPETGKIKWQRILETANRYYEPGKFTTIPAYERDSYPWFSNMVIYFRSAENANLIRGARDGELTESELRALSERRDVLYGPHTCGTINPGTDLTGRPAELTPRTFEIYSRGGAYEMYDGDFPASTGVRGCYYADALENGAKPACIACTDDHAGFGGRDVADRGYGYAGMTGVYAENNTREAIFDALAARRCYAFMGAKRVTVDFRINGCFMGEEIWDSDDKRTIFFSIGGETPVDRVDLIKNGRSVVFFRNAPRKAFFDYTHERDEDWYYLRIRLKDGRYAWTSPIWVKK